MAIFRQTDSAMPCACNVDLVDLWGNRYRVTRCRSAHTQDGQSGQGTNRAPASNYFRHRQWYTCVHRLFAQCRRERRTDKLCMASCTTNQTQLLANAYSWCSSQHVSRIDRTRSMTLNSHKTHCDASMCYSAMANQDDLGFRHAARADTQAPQCCPPKEPQTLISTTACAVL